MFLAGSTSCPTAAIDDFVQMFFFQNVIKCRADEGVTPKASRKFGLLFNQLPFQEE